MADRLTQLQDAVDQLATQFLASVHFVNKHHDLQTLSEDDSIRDTKKDSEATPKDPGDVDPFSPEQFKAGQIELARDLVMKEQQIELLISMLPGLNNSEKEQEEMIKQLEEDLKVAEEERQQALKEKEAVLERLEAVIRNIKRP